MVELDHGTLHAAAAQVEKFHDELRDVDLVALRGAAESISTIWKGQAAGAYTAVMQRWDGDVKKLLDAVATIGALLKKTANISQAVDEGQQSAMNKIGADLATPTLHQ